MQSRVATLIRTPPLVCQGSEPVREAAKRMTDQGASAVLVPHGGTFGIVTDRDLRSRVIAAGLSPDAPVSAIMTEPAYTVTADRLGGDVLLDMLERNVHHIPVCPRPARCWAWSTTATWSPPRGASRSCCAAPSRWRRAPPTWRPWRPG